MKKLFNKHLSMIGCSAHLGFFLVPARNSSGGISVYSRKCRGFFWRFFLVASLPKSLSNSDQLSFEFKRLGCLHPAVTRRQLMHKLR